MIKIDKFGFLLLNSIYIRYSKSHLSLVLSSFERWELEEVKGSSPSSRVGNAVWRGSIVASAVTILASTELRPVTGLPTSLSTLYVHLEVIPISGAVSAVMTLIFFMRPLRYIYTCKFVSNQILNLTYIY